MIWSAAPYAEAGARAIVLSAERVDGDTRQLTIGASRATRDAGHLKRMFALRLVELEPRFGIGVMNLAVPHAEPPGT